MLATRADGGTHAAAASILHGDVRGLQLWVSRLGVWAAFAILVLALVHTVVPFPIELLAAAAGFALGVWVALPLMVASLLASGLLAYAIGAHVGRPVIDRLVGSSRMSRLEQRISRCSPLSLLAVRAFPLLPFSPVSIACGMLKIPIRRFVWTTALGILPELAVVTFFGDRLRAGFSSVVLWASAGVLLVLLVLGSWLTRNNALGRPISD